ncbi:MAG TPA: biopolymer transporter ExbD [Kofleriaceae bacterium]|nr:biopolymer transporter ExbD [Kofleriaceae bacterium]
MGQAIGTGDKKSVNVELNIIPFIDLMSCLTAFLLVTAVWVNLASVKNDPAGKAKSDVEQPPAPKLAVLIEHDQILVQATPSGEARQLAAFDWSGLETTLRDLKTPGEVPQVEIAAESSNTHPIAYQQLIAAMDVAVKAGYPRVGVTDPSSLTR